MRAWFSMATTPRPRISFCWTWFHSLSMVAPPSEKIPRVWLTAQPNQAAERRAGDRAGRDPEKVASRETHCTLQTQAWLLSRQA